VWVGEEEIASRRPRVVRPAEGYGGTPRWPLE
jgi:hypothetical protein